MARGVKAGPTPLWSTADKIFQVSSFYKIYIDNILPCHIIQISKYIYHMICKSLYLSNSCLFRQEAQKLGVKVNVVSHNLGTEIRNELRWESRNLMHVFLTLFLTTLCSMMSCGHVSWLHMKFDLIWNHWCFNRTSVDIMRVHEGVRRLRRKSNGSVTTKATSSAIVDERQSGVLYWAN